jgi:hypothetical protein
VGHTPYLPNGIDRFKNNRFFAHAFVFMRIILQQVKSALYFKSLGIWTQDVSEALDFRTSQHAIRHVRQHHLQGVQVLAAFVEPAYIETAALQIPAAEMLRPAA